MCGSVVTDPRLDATVFQHSYSATCKYSVDNKCTSRKISPAVNILTFFRLLKIVPLFLDSILAHFLIASGQKPGPLKPRTQQVPGAPSLGV
jgi:hypothetical protein